MNVFDDLIDELKEENLLERTGVGSESTSASGHIHHSPNGSSVLLEESACVLEKPAQKVIPVDEPFFVEGEPVVSVDAPNKSPSSKPSHDPGFSTKRAIGEMSNLQMVEHVLTGVEREYMKIVPKIFDDFGAKKALNAFLQASEDENSSEHSKAKLAMMQETEAWCSTLAERDKAVSVASVRHYCENSRPALSSQALVALARFYRNLPYSETGRSKFDFVITRLFSRPAPGNKRICLFSREEMLNHISLLYKEWSSVPLYTAEEDESKVLLVALSFEELALEAENASNFDLLVANDFFGRLGMFKESVSELFFAPNVTAAAIDCNVRVGNAYVSLIDKERFKTDSQAMYSKFAAIDNLTVSDAAARTLEIVDILRKQRDYLGKDPVHTVRPDRSTESAESTPMPFEGNEYGGTETFSAVWLIKNKIVSRILSVNKWLLVLSGAIIALSFGIFAWSTLYTQPAGPDKSVRSIELSDPVLRTHLRTARISGPHFYGLLLPSWETLSPEKREEYLKTVFEFAKEKGCAEVDLLNSEGRPAAYASSSRLEIIAH